MPGRRTSRRHRDARLADDAGVNVFATSKTERGLQEPAWPLVLALAGALGVEVGAFVVNGAAPQEARPRGRPRKAATVAQETTSRGGTAGEPSGEKKPATSKGRQGK